MSAAQRSRGSEISAMVRGTIVLGIVVLVVAGFLGTCSFAPGAPEVDRSALPRVDVPARLNAAAAAVPFAVRAPTLPPEWIAQSQDVVPVGPEPAPRAVRVGWVTPEDRFARLVQTAADPAAAVVSERGDPAPRGTVSAGGRTWTVHVGVRDEAVWVTDLDGVRLVVTGSAGPPELTTLAAASVAAAPLGR